MTREIIIVGDELHFDGFIVGKLFQSKVPATIKGAVLDCLNKRPPPRVPVKDEILTCLGRRSGPLSIADVRRVLDRYKGKEL